MGPRPAALLLATLAAAGCAGIPGRGGEDVRALPAYERETPVAGAPRTTDWLWPFGHGDDAPASRTSGFRPLWRTVATDSLDRTEVLYPLYRTQEEKGEVVTRLWPLYWHDEMPGEAGPDSDTAVLPFLFWGSDPAEGGYFCLFPLAGTVKEKFLSDRTTFVLFPLYAGTRTGDWRGRHPLWPLIHWGSEGTGRRAFRFLPFYGEHTKAGVYSRHTLLWPLVHWAEENLDRPHPVRGWLVWPFYGTEGSDGGYRHRTVLWPLFHWADGPRTYERSLPYPFFRVRREWAEGEEGGEPETDLFWLWPFYGRFDRRDQEHTRFYAWPLVWSWEVEEGGVREEAFVVAPFWRSIRNEGKGGERLDSRWQLWPLARGEGRADGSSGWSALSPIPWMRWEEFDANWGVFFELARVRRGPDGSRSTDLLFSLLRTRTGPGEEHHRIPLLVRADRDATGQSWSILEGLLGGETAPGGGSSLRLLWFLRIPLSGKRE